MLFSLHESIVDTITSGSGKFRRRKCPPCEVSTAMCVSEALPYPRLFFSAGMTASWYDFMRVSLFLGRWIMELGLWTKMEWRFPTSGYLWRRKICQISYSGLDGTQVCQIAHLVRWRSSSRCTTLSKCDIVFRCFYSKSLRSKPPSSLPYRYNSA